MAYTPKTWTCGETITDAGLNNIEQGIQEALGCCESELPEVTTADNGKVLTVINGEWDKGEGGSGGLPAVTTADNGDILTVVDGEWEKAEPGYKCTSTSTTLTEESVTTALDQYGTYSGQFSYSSFLEADTLTVTFNGTEYEADRIDLPSGWHAYGGMGSSGPDFSEYPFLIVSSGSANTLYTENAGTYSVKIEIVSETVETSECFEKAVKKFGLEHIFDGVADGSLRSNTSTAEGNGYALGVGAVSLGVGTKASGSQSHAEGYNTTASGMRSHAEGISTTASGVPSHAEGASTTASGDGSHAEGSGTNASGIDSHAEGNRTTASSSQSHAEGDQTTASNFQSHAEGYNTTASGERSHAEGISTTASGNGSHAQNSSTIAQGMSQTAIGKFNVAQGTNNSIATTDYAFIIGNGANASSRSNAFAIKWDGTFVFADGTEITPAQFAQILALI